MAQLVSRKIFHGVLSGLGRTVVSILVALVQLGLVFRFLPQDMAGVWLLFLTLGTYIAFFDLGISPTVSREIAFITGGDDSVGQARDQRIADLLSTCVRIFLILGVVAFILGLVAGGTFLWSISPAESRREIGIAWLVFLLGAATNIIGGAAFASLYGLGDVATERIIRSLADLLGLGLSYLSLYFGFGIVGLAVSWVTQNLLARGAAILALHRNHPWLKSVRGKAQMTIFSRIAGPSLKWAVMGLGAILILQSNNIIIAAMLGPAAIPQYEAVVKVAMALMTFSLLIVTTTTPFLSKAYAAGENEAVIELLLRSVRFSVSAMCFLVSFIAVFGAKIIELWLGAGNFVGFPVLWTLLVMVLLEVHHVSFAAATMATGRLAFTGMGLGAGVLSILLSSALARPFGLCGVALGTMIAQLLTNNWYAPYLSLKHFKISRTVYLRSVLLPVAVMFSLCLLVNYVLDALMKGPGTVLVLSSSFLFSLVFGLSVFFFVVLRADERRIAVSSVKL